MSSEHSRTTRPKLERTSARRSLSNLFVPPAIAPAMDGAEGRAHGAPTEPWTDVVARSVDLGYRVIDDYVRQGEQVAKAMSERGPAAGAMSGFVDTQDVARRMAQYAMEMTTLWFQMMQGAQSTPGWIFPPFPGFVPPPTAPWPGAPSTASPPQRPMSTSPSPASDEKRVRVCVSVRSARPTEVVLDLRPDAGQRRMVVQSLRSATTGPPRLSDVALTGDGVDDPLTLHVHVPDDQPAGVYNGLVIEEDSGLPLGTVSLRIMPE